MAGKPRPPSGLCCINSIMKKYFPYLRLIILTTILVLTFISFGPHFILASNATGPGNTTPPPSGTPPPNITPPSTYLNNLYKWFLGAVGISALFAIVLGGVLYMLSGTNLTKVEQARGWIRNGIWGIVIAAISFLLLRTINPDLVTHGFDLNKVIENALPPPK